MSWKLLPHTADLRIEGSGTTREAALAALAEGLIDQLGGAGRSGGQTRRLEVRGVDLADTVVTALGEILWLANGERWLASGCQVESLADESAALILTGDPIGEEGEGVREVKAATYHGFEFFEGEGGYHLRVIFDV